MYLFAPQRLEGGFVHVLLLLFWARSISALHVKGLHSRQPLLLIPAAAPGVALSTADITSRRICYNILAQFMWPGWSRQLMSDTCQLVRVCQLNTQIPLLRSDSVVHPLLHPGTESTNCMPCRPIADQHLDRAFILWSHRAGPDLRRACGEKPCLLRCQASTTASSIAKQKPCPTCMLQLCEVAGYGVGQGYLLCKICYVRIAM